MYLYVYSTLLTYMYMGLLIINCSKIQYCVLYYYHDGWVPSQSLESINIIMNKTAIMLKCIVHAHLTFEINISAKRVYCQSLQKRKEDIGTFLLQHVC